jgi:hypothetical protein
MNNSTLKCYPLGCVRIVCAISSRPVRALFDRYAVDFCRNPPLRAAYIHPEYRTPVLRNALLNSMHTSNSVSCQQAVPTYGHLSCLSNVGRSAANANQRAAMVKALILIGEDCWLGVALLYKQFARLVSEGCS